MRVGTESLRTTALRFRHWLAAVLTPLYESIHRAPPCGVEGTAVVRGACIFLCLRSARLARGRLHFGRRVWPHGLQNMRKPLN